MGKAQSKRSVDITTDPKKGPEDEVTGKMEKIEDVDQKEVNGDATIQEKCDAEKKDTEETENDKDLTTEKSSGDAAKGGGDSVEQNPPTASAVTEGGDTPKEDANATKEGVSTDETTPVADESIKKSKKDKVKKKWSLRSISFGKKDKQKPAKTEETTETSPTTAAAATNGDGEKTPEEGETVEASKKEGADESIAANKTPSENGETKAELNGEKTPTEVINAIDTNTTTETSPPLSNDTATEIQTEKPAIADPVTITTAAAPAAPIAEVITNGNVDDIAKNGVAENEDVASVIKAPEGAVESNKTIPSVEETPHQNGTNGDANGAEEQKTTTKSQIEVNTINTSPTTSMNNILVNDQEETLVLTQTITTSKSFQTTENSENFNDNTLVSSSSSISDNVPQVQTIPTVEENISKENLEILETALKNNLVDAAANSDEINFVVNTKEISRDISAENFDLDASVKESSIDKPVAPASEVCSQAIEKQTEVQAPPPLPASPPPSRVSVFAFKDSDVDDFVKDVQLDSEKATTDNTSNIQVGLVSDAIEVSKEFTDEQAAEILYQIESENKGLVEETVQASVNTTILSGSEKPTIDVTVESKTFQILDSDPLPKFNSNDSEIKQLDNIQVGPHEMQNQLILDDTSKDKANVANDSSIQISDIIAVDNLCKYEVTELVSVEPSESEANLGLNTATETNVVNVLGIEKLVEKETDLHKENLLDVQAVEIIRDQRESQDTQFTNDGPAQLQTCPTFFESDNLSERFPKEHGDGDLGSEEKSLHEYTHTVSGQKSISIEQDSLNANTNVKEIIDSQNDVDLSSEGNNLKSIIEDSLNANDESKVSEEFGSCDILLNSSVGPDFINISTTDEGPKQFNGNNKSINEVEVVEEINHEEVKEINVKDLKENAAAETTQDLPVTCE